MVNYGLKKYFALGIGIGCIAGLSAETVVKPELYTRAIRNPLKGFTSGSEWSTLQHTYIRWNEIGE